MAPRRILLIARDMVGDLVNTTGAVAYLRASWPEVHWILEGGTAAVDLFPGVEVWVRPRRGGLPGKIRRALRYRAGRFDAALVLDDSRLAARLARWAGIPKVYCGGRGLDFAPTGHDLFDPLGKTLAEFADAEGLTFSPEDLAPTLPIPSEEAPLPGVILHATASDPAKEWPDVRWIELARAVDCYIAGGPGDEARVRAIADASGRTGLPAMGLMEYARRIRQAPALVTADTGPAHLAGAVGTHCVVLYGPTDPERFHPWGSHWSAVRKRTECEHYGRGCAFREAGGCSQTCMRAIEVADVLEALKQQGLAC